MRAPQPIRLWTSGFELTTFWLAGEHPPTLVYSTPHCSEEHTRRDVTIHRSHPNVYVGNRSRRYESPNDKHLAGIDYCPDFSFQLSKSHLVSLPRSISWLICNWLLQLIYQASAPSSHEPRTLAFCSTIIDSSSKNLISSETWPPFQRYVTRSTGLDTVHDVSFNVSKQWPLSLVPVAPGERKEPRCGSVWPVSLSRSSADISVFMCGCFLDLYPPVPSL